MLSANLADVEAKIAGSAQRRLAELVGVDPVTLRGWECGRHKPAKKLLEKLKQVFPEFD